MLDDEDQDALSVKTLQVIECPGCSADLQECIVAVGMVCAICRTCPTPGGAVLKCSACNVFICGLCSVGLGEPEKSMGVADGGSGDVPACAAEIPQGQQLHSSFVRHRLSRRNACSNCSKEVCRGKWGLRCSICHDFVCAVACRRALEAGRGCSCVASAALPDIEERLPDSAVRPVVSLPSLPSHDPQFDLYSILKYVSALPAPQLLPKCPTNMEVRFGTILRDALIEHVNAEQAAHKHPTEEKQVKADFQSRFLWTITPALLRKPVLLDTVNVPEDALHTSLKVKQYVQHRL